MKDEITTKISEKLKESPLTEVELVDILNFAEDLKAGKNLALRNLIFRWLR
jgi:hypothetical protein